MDESTPQLPHSGLTAGFLAAALLCTGAPAASAQDIGTDATAPASESGADSADRTLEVTLEQKLDAPETPAVGDPLELVLSIEHPPDATVRLQNPVLDGSRWHLVETRRSEAKSEDRTTTQITAVFQIFRPGEATLDPQTVRVSTDEVERTVETNPETVEIAATLDEPGEASFQGPRPPRPVWQRDWTFAWVGGGLLAAAIALGVLGVMRRREDEADATPDRPPEEVARERLEELAATDLLDHGDFMVYYVRLSEIVRRYLGRRYGFPGTELTTSEILERLADTPALDEAKHRDIGEWLRAADLVKFSGLIPSVEEAEEHLDRAFELIEVTAPVAEPENDESEKDDEEATADDKEATPGRRRTEATAGTPQHQSEATPGDKEATAGTPQHQSEATPGDKEATAETPQHQSEATPEDNSADADSRDDDSEDTETDGESVDGSEKTETPDAEPNDETSEIDTDDEECKEAESAEASDDDTSDETDGGDASTDVPAEHAPYAPPGARPDDSADDDDEPRRDGDD